MLELKQRHRIAGLPGRLALTLFNSRARMGLLDDALSLARNTATPVDSAAVRKYRSRTGASLNLEQQLRSDLG